MFPLGAATPETTPGSSVLALILFLIAAVWAVAWIIFPFIVITKFNDLMKLQQRTNEWLKQIFERLPEPPMPPRPSDSEWLMPKTPGVPPKDEPYRL